jgi:hypothetical protein
MIYANSISGSENLCCIRSLALNMWASSAHGQAVPRSRFGSRSCIRSEMHISLVCGWLGLRTNQYENLVTSMSLNLLTWSDPEGCEVEKPASLFCMTICSISTENCIHYYLVVQISTVLTPSRRTRADAVSSMAFRFHDVLADDRI